MKEGHGSREQFSSCWSLLLRWRRVASQCDRNSRSDVVHVDSDLDESFHFIQTLKPGFSIIFTVQVGVKVSFYSWSMVWKMLYDWNYAVLQISHRNYLGNYLVQFYKYGNSLFYVLLFKIQKLVNDSVGSKWQVSSLWNGSLNKKIVPSEKMSSFFS